MEEEAQIREIPVIVIVLFRFAKSTPPFSHSALDGASGL